ncbi:MAG: HEAT repeat domain-containing protein [Planctomycetes bacterium]|nr:HEAT repeat domain-containing protein [Planctomycetota bacterium]
MLQKHRGARRNLIAHVLLTMGLWPGLLGLAGEEDERLREGVERTASKRGNDMEVEDVADPELVSEAEVERLLHATGGGDSQTRRAALWAMSAYRHEQLAQRVVAILDGSFEIPDRDGVLPAAALAAGRMKLRSAVSPLERCLSSESAWLRESALWALGEMGDAGVQEVLQGALEKGQTEWERWLAAEALNKAAGRQSLPDKGFQPRPLEGVKVLWVGIGPRHAYHFAQPVRDAQVHPPAELARRGVIYQGVFVNHLNPAMGYFGGLSGPQAQKLLEGLVFEEGRPKFDAVVFHYLIPQDAPGPFLKWRLWNYIRRGGRLIVIGETLLQAASIMDPRRGTMAVKVSWEMGLFDTALPAEVVKKPLPFQLGQERLGMAWTGYRDLGVGRTLLVCRPVDPARAEAPLDDLHRQVFIGHFNRDQPAIIASDEEWLALFQWALGGTEALVARLAPEGPPKEVRAGEQLVLKGTSSRFVPGDGFRLEFLVSDARDPAKIHFRAERALADGAFEWPVALTDALPDASYLMVWRLVAPGAAEPVQEIRRVVTVRARVGLEVSGPALLPEPGETCEVAVTVRHRWGGPLAEAELRVGLVDFRGRWICFRHESFNLAAGGQVTRPVTFAADAVAPGRYRLMAEVASGGMVIARAAAAADRRNHFDFTQALIWTPFRSNQLLTEEQVEAFRDLGVNCLYDVSSYGLYSASLNSPMFIPKGQWPREIEQGQIGEEWRDWGRKTAVEPLYTLTDTIEEADLEIGSKVHQEGYGDVVQEGHEQYRIYLRSRYRTLSALNGAWKTDYASWNQVYLMGPSWDGRAVTFTARMGGGGGQMVPVPQAIDEAAGIPSLAPYEDQNAFRWTYISLIHRIRYDAYHSVDDRHVLTPGGASGLAGSWDNHHWRHYLGWIYNPSFAATLARPNYGLKPFTCLIGCKSTYAQMSWLHWSALLGGARAFMPYSDGSPLGDYLLDERHRPTSAGESLARVVRRLLPRQQVLLDTRNRVESGVLLYGDFPYGDAPPQWLFEAMALQRILPDFGSRLAGRKIVFVPGNGPAEALDGLAKAGATVLTLVTTASGVTQRFGLQRDALPAAEPAAALPKAHASGAGGGEGITSLMRERVEAGNARATWSYPDGIPAMLEHSHGQGRHIHLNFVPDRESLSVAASLLGAILGQTGIRLPVQVLDTDGRIHRGVAAFELETFDGTQHYLCVCPDLPADPGLEDTEIAGRIVLPEERAVQSVVDVFSGRRASLERGGGEYSFTFSLLPGEGTLFSLLEEETSQPMVSLSTAAAVPGEPLRVGVAIPGGGNSLSESSHSVRVQVLDARGTTVPGLGASGKVVRTRFFTLFPAENDPPGDWMLEVADLATGVTFRATLPRGILADQPLLRASVQTGGLLLGGESLIGLRLENLGRAELPAGALRISSTWPEVQAAPGWKGELREALGPGQVKTLEMPLLAAPDAPEGEALLTVTAEGAGGQGHASAFALNVPEPLDFRLGSTPELDADVTYFPVEATIRSHLAVRVTGQVDLGLVGEKLLRAQPVMDFKLGPGGSFVARWEVRLTRQEALALRRAEASRLADDPVPGESLYGVEPARSPWAVTWSATLEGGKKLAGALRIPVRLNRFEPRPPRLRALSAETVRAAVSNVLDRPVVGQLELRGRETWREQTMKIPFRVGPGTTFRAEFPVQLRQGADMDPGLQSAELSVIEDGAARALTAITVEESEAMRWWVKGPLAGAVVDAAEEPSEGPPEKDAASAGWQEMIADGFVPLPGTARNCSPGVYLAYARYRSERAGTVRINLYRLVMPGSGRNPTALVRPNRWVEHQAFRAWVNGEAAGGMRPATAGDEVEMSDFSEEGSEKEGLNSLCIAFDRDGEMEGILVKRVVKAAEK